MHIITSVLYTDIYVCVYIYICVCIYIYIYHLGKQVIKS